MHRDLPQNLPRRSSSPASTTRFLYIVEAVARAHEPTSTQLDELQRAYESTAEYLVGAPEFAGLLWQVYAHGSRQQGNMVRPADTARDGYDIDLVARLARAALARYGGDQGAILLLQHLFDVLSRYADRHGLSIKRWDRCVTLTYAGGMRADFAPVIDDPLHAVTFGDTHGRIPDRELRRYVVTNPRGLCHAYDEAARISPVFRALDALTANFAEARKAEILPLPDPADVFGRLLSRMSQVTKIHRDIAFGAPTVEDFRPTSVFVVTLLTMAYTIEARKSHDGPLDLLFDMLELMPLLFERRPQGNGTEYWHLHNPTAPGDNLAESMNQPGKQAAFWKWHARLLDDLRQLLDAIDNDAGMDAVLKLVERSFGRRACLAIEQESRSQRERLRSAGRSILLTTGGMTLASATKAHTFFGA